MKKLLAILVALATLLSLCSCSLLKKDTDKEEKETELQSANSSNSQANNNTQDVGYAFSENLAIEKVGILNTEYFTICEGGLIYKNENGLKGVMSFNGEYVGEALYTYCEYDESYFVVSKVNDSATTDVAKLNTHGLIDANGRTIIPEIYGKIDVLGDDYAVAYTYTGETTETLSVTYSYIDGAKKYFGGSYCVYNLNTGLQVSGISGTTAPYALWQTGNYLEYRATSSSDKILLNNTGKTFPDGSKIFSDSSYKMESTIGDVYSADGTKLFSYDLTGYIPVDVYGDYYIAKLYSNGITTYALMDKSGNVITADFAGNGRVYGNLFYDNYSSNRAVYTFNGTLVADNLSTAEYDPVLDMVLATLKDDKGYLLIDGSGAIVFNSAEHADTKISSSYFVPYKEKNNERMYYSFKDEAFTIKASGYSSTWLMSVENNNRRYDLVNATNGKTLIQGYASYSFSENIGKGYYVYAKYSGGAEVYFVASEATLAQTVSMKNNLMTDLSAALVQADIPVTINPKTGEIAIDSAILFGGDSAELTVEGKEFLNKFINIYSSVVGNSKYNSFVSKTVVEGHAAPLANSTYASGLQLSQDRANNVKNYCVSPEAGADVSSIEASIIAIGYSNSQPILNDDGSVNVEASRRVSFRILVNITY